MGVKKYYWLKLMESFFEEDTIAWLEEQENGVYYTNFYLKLCLKSLKTNGILVRNVGEILIPYDIKKLSEITHVKIDTAIVAMELFKKIGLVEILENGEIYLKQLELMVGKETSKAAIMRNKRKIEKLNGSDKDISDDNKKKKHNGRKSDDKRAKDDKEDDCDESENFSNTKDEINENINENSEGNNVTNMLPKCYTEKEIDKELDIDKETELDKHRESDKERDKEKKIETDVQKNIGRDKELDIDKECKSESRKVCGGVSIFKDEMSLGRNNNGDFSEDSYESESSNKSSGVNCENDSGLKNENPINNNSEFCSVPLRAGKADVTCSSSNCIDSGEEYSSKTKVFKHFEKCGFIVTRQLMEYIAEDINTYSEDWVIEAANECVTRNKADNYSYLTGILQRWKARGRVERSLKGIKANASAYEPMTSILD